MTPDIKATAEHDPRELVARLRKASVAVYLAAEEGPADDLSATLKASADWIEKAAERENAVLLKYADISHYPDMYRQIIERVEAAERANVRLRELGENLINLVEGVFGYGTLRPETPGGFGERLKYTKEWVAFYNAIHALAPDGAKETTQRDVITRDRDIILEAINTYDQWMLNDDYDAGETLRGIIERMRFRAQLVALAPDNAKETT